MEQVDGSWTTPPTLQRPAPLNLLIYTEGAFYGFRASDAGGFVARVSGASDEPLDSAPPVWSSYCGTAHGPWLYAISDRSFTTTVESGAPDRFAWAEVGQEEVIGRRYNAGCVATDYGVYLTGGSDPSQNYVTTTYRAAFTASHGLGPWEPIASPGAGRYIQASILAVPQER